MKRRKFLSHFLGALGAKEIEWNAETEDFISGRVFYSDDREQYQDFFWHKSEMEVPEAPVCNLAKLLHENQLLSIDQIKISRADLLQLYNSTFGINLSTSEFLTILEGLEEVEVPMVDNGKEVDVYVIHE